MNLYEIKCKDEDGIETSLKISSDMETVEELEEVLEKLFKFFLKTGAVDELQNDKLAYHPSSEYQSLIQHYHLPLLIH